MSKFMCMKTTYVDSRLYTEGTIYDLAEAPNRHFQPLESPKAEMERIRENLPSGGKKDDKTLDLMGDQGKEKSAAGETLKGETPKGEPPRGEKKDGRKSER